METRAARLQNVINDALTSTVKADQLRAMALAAQQSCIGSQPWIDFVNLFATNDQELSELSTLKSAGAFTFCTVPTTHLLNAVSTVECTTTTTHTTTTYFCPREGEAARAKTTKKVIGKKRRKVR